MNKNSSQKNIRNSGDSSKKWTNEQAELLDINNAGLPRYPRVAVTADAGSGKTSVLTERVIRLLQDSTAQHPLHATKKVLCVSFTEKSAADLEQRLIQYLRAEVYTIHGFCLRLVQEFSVLLGLPPILELMDEEESSDLFYECFEKTYRRQPPENEDHASQALYQLCRLAKDRVSWKIQCEDGGTEYSNFVQAVLEEYALAKNRRHRLDYSDLEKLAVQLLNFEEVVLKIRARYFHFFIDEFQDTSELQCDFVQKLVGNEACLFVVGDEKQSIYRFRGANVEVFRRFSQRLAHQKRLSKNFRSLPKIIDGVNQVCEPVIDHYSPMTVGLPVTDNLGEAIRVTSDTDAQGVLSVLRSLQGEGFDLSEVVLLLPRMKGNQKLFEELKANGVFIATTSSGNQQMEPAIDQLSNLWIWACEPWQRLSAAQVVVDFSDYDQDLIRSDLEENILKLKSPLALRPHLSCEQLLDELNALFKLEARFGALFAQFTLLVLKHQSDGFTPGRFAERLARVKKTGGNIQGLLLLPPPPQMTGTLRVMTVHASKGLEFPIVLLADLKTMSRSGGSVIAESHDLWVAGREDSGELRKWEGYRQAAARESEAEIKERARLLYVAMTRAEKKLYVIDRKEDVPEPSKKVKPAKPNWQTWLRAGLSVGVPIGLQSGAMGADSEPNPMQTSFHEVGSRVALEDQAPVYSSARIGATELAQELEQEVKTFSGGARILSAETAQEIGIELHRYLETEDWNEMSQFEVRTKSLDLSKFWEWKESEAGKLVFEPNVASRILREFAFEWSGAQGVVTGRMDRLMEFENEVWIIDYKIRSRKTVADDFRLRYKSQLLIYRDAVKGLTKDKKIRLFLIDILGSTGEVWHEVLA